MVHRYQEHNNDHEKSIKFFLAGLNVDFAKKNATALELLGVKNRVAEKENTAQIIYDNFQQWTDRIKI